MTISQSSELPPVNEGDIVYFPTPKITEKHHYKLSTKSVQVLKAGTVQVDGHRPLLSDILVEKHIAITVRDGTTLYADIYRPANAPAANVPCIIAAGPFGKDGGPNKWHFNQWPWRFGCPRIATSGLEKFEGPDPGYWCYHGYAIAHTGNTPTSVTVSSNSTDHDRLPRRMGVRGRDCPNADRERRPG